MLIFRLIGISLLLLGGLVGIVILVLPLGFLQQAGIFLRKPELSLWLFFVLVLTVGSILFVLGSVNRPIWRLFKVGGSALLVLGFASAIEIFLITANLLSARRTISLW